MIEALGNPAFYNPALFGLLGVALWILVTWMDPTDDTITGSIRVLAKHTRPLVIALVSYVMVCLMLFRFGEFSDVMAGLAGYTNHSLVVKMFDAAEAKIKARISNGGQ